MSSLVLSPQPPMGPLPHPNEFLRDVIPSRQVHFIAQNFFVHADTIRRWRRRPSTRQERRQPGPIGTGAASPLDRVCHLIRLIASYDFKLAGQVAEYPRLYYLGLTEECGSEGFGDERARTEANLKLLDEATDAVKAMSLVGITLETLREQIELRDVAQQMIVRTYATMLRRAA